MNLKEQKVLIALIICFLISLIGSLMSVFFEVDVSAQTLSEDYLEILKMQAFAKVLRNTCALSCLFYILAIVNYIYGYYRTNDGVTGKLLISAFLGVVFFLVGLVNAVPIAVNKAEARVGIVSEKDTRYRSGGRYSRGSTSYYLIFEDGGKISVPDDQYYATEIGDSYYTVYCGRKIIGIYDMETYRLPADSN